MRASGRAEVHQRQGHRLQGHPDQDQGHQGRAGLLRRHGRPGRPDGQADEGTGHQRPSSSPATAAAPRRMKLPARPRRPRPLLLAAGHAAGEDG